ncbi:hypothetical protein QZH41_020212 [Actinostola sp. cb2023]|nr:hypothetical protein QZH41_020212 [Actinostola sp. cb2023]
MAGIVKKETTRQIKDIERLAHDMSLLTTMSEVYDVHFLVGKEKEYMGGVKAILAARSRVFFNMLFAGQGVRGRGRDSGTPKKTPKKQSSFAFLKRDSKTDLKVGKVSSCVTIPIEDFEAEEFARLMEFLHCGRCTLESHCIVGLLAAADFFAVEDLQMAACNFIDKCITIDNVCHFLCEAERYIQLKSVKSLVPKLLEFTAIHAREVLGRVPFCTLPRHVVRLILARKDLDATESEKFTAVLTWGHAYCDKYADISLKAALEPLVDCIVFYKIPTMQLMQEVRQMDIVPDHVLMKALAYQADPMSVSLKGSQKATGARKIGSQTALNNNTVHEDEANGVTFERLIKG